MSNKLESSDVWMVEFFQTPKTQLTVKFLPGLDQPHVEKEILSDYPEAIIRKIVMLKNY